jgi:signal transduction histidine kinase
MKNDIGAIRTLAQDIWKTSNMSEDTKHALFDIQFLADQVLQEARDLNRWILLNPQPVDIRETIHSALNRVAIPSSITKNISLPSNLPRASGAEQQLTDVFINLLQNAIEAMPTGGILSIKAKNIELESKQWLVVEVLDTGKGIPEEDLEKIFQRNYSTKDTKKNLGFGLWWTRLYIERLGGQLTVESWPRKKTLFTVTLRCYKP